MFTLNDEALETIVGGAITFTGNQTGNATGGTGNATGGVRSSRHDEREVENERDDCRRWNVVPPAK